MVTLLAALSMVNNVGWNTLNSRGSSLPDNVQPSIRIFSAPPPTSMQKREEQALLKHAYLNASDVVQEVHDSIEVWHSWLDIAKAWTGWISLDTLVSRMVKRKGPLINELAGNIHWMVGCYIGIRGLQCKAQQYRLVAPDKIKHLVEQAIQTIDEGE